MAEERINHDYTSEPICPHCGRAVRDAWELGESTDEYECGGCERLFSISRHIEVTWCTEKIDEPAPIEADQEDEERHECDYCGAINTNPFGNKWICPPCADDAR